MASGLTPIDPSFVTPPPSPVKTSGSPSSSIQQSTLGSNIDKFIVALRETFSISQEKAEVVALEIFHIQRTNESLKQPGYCKYLPAADDFPHPLIVTHYGAYSVQTEIASGTYSVVLRCKLLVTKRHILNGVLVSPSTVSVFALKRLRSHQHPTSGKRYYPPGFSPENEPYKMHPETPTIPE